MKVLIVDDDRDLVEMVSFALKRNGFEVLRAFNAPEALRHVNEDQPDLAVLDVNMGAWSGFDLLRDLRKISQIPVIMLTGRDAEDDKVRGLELGADDYVTKPFSYRELVARIRSSIRRSQQEPAPTAGAQDHLSVGPLELDVPTHTARLEGRELRLTVTEFKLLQRLMAEAGTVVPTRTLLRQVWGYDDPSGADVVRVTVHRLRRKVEADPAAPRLLHTVPGVGVMLRATPDGMAPDPVEEDF